MGRTDQIVRVLNLAHALATARRGIALRAFAKKRRFPERSVYNDFKTLEKAGFPIVEVQRGRYRLSDTWRPIGMPHLDSDEALALFLARQLMSNMRATSMGRALDRVWTKLSGSAAQAALVPDHAPWLSVRAPIAIDYSHHAATIGVLENAIRDREVVRCRYRRVTGEETDRDVEPGELHWDPGLESLYSIAWCRLRSSVRIFAVHRFLSAAATGERFEPRPGIRSSVALRNAFRVWRSETVSTVKLRLRGRPAQEATERTWHSSQKVESENGGTVIVTLEIAEVAELVPWLLGLGPDVSVLEPRALAKDLAELHRQAVSAVVARSRSARTRGRIESLPAAGNTRGENRSARGR